MPPRLHHKKSRLGCQRCKERRVKCDEMHPTCGSCRAHNVHCIYQNSPRGSPNASSPTTISVLSGGEMRRMSELRLLHHFINDVSPTLPCAHPDNHPNMWATSVVDLALEPENAFLLHAIFATSSLHWKVINSLSFNQPALSNPLNTPSIDLPAREKAKLDAIGLDLIHTHRLYLDLAVQEHRLKISSPSSPETRTADTIYLTSVLMLIIAVRMNAVQSVEDYQTASVQWRRMAWAMSGINKNDLGPLARDAYAALNMDPEQSTKRRGWSEVVGSKECMMLKAILEFDHDQEGDQDGESEMSAEDVYAYAKAAEYIGTGLIAGSEGVETGRRMARRIMGFPAEVPERFLELLEKKDARAFVMFTYLMWCARYADKDKDWWLEGVAERCSARIATFVPAKWHWALPKPDNVDGDEFRETKKWPKGHDPQGKFYLLDSLNVSM